MKKRLRLKCPICGYNFETEHYSSYNVQEENGIEAILNDSWIKHECPKCHNKINVMDIMTFHDMEKKLMIFFFPEHSGTTEEHCEFVSQYNYPPNYTIRIVENKFNDFKEKIILLENGLDDYKVEIYKLMLIKGKYDISNVSESHIVFDDNLEPIGVVLYSNGKLLECIKFDKEKYENIKTIHGDNNLLVRYSLINKGAL